MGGLVGLFIGLQLGGAFGPGWVHFREKFDDFVSTLMVSSIAFFLPIFGLSFLLSQPLSLLFGLPDWVVPLIFLQSFMSVVQGFFYDLFSAAAAVHVDFTPIGTERCYQHCFIFISHLFDGE